MHSRLAVPALTLILVGAGLASWGPAAWPNALGLAIAAGAPLTFVLRHGIVEAPLRGHPIVVSCLSGLGCVVIMIGQQRFGAEPIWALPAALAALVIWMLWQRRQRHSDDPRV